MRVEIGVWVGAGLGQSHLLALILTDTHQLLPFVRVGQLGTPRVRGMVSTPRSREGAAAGVTQVGGPGGRCLGLGLFFFFFFFGGGGLPLTTTSAAVEDNGHVQNHTTWSTAGCEDISEQGKPCTLQPPIPPSDSQAPRSQQAAPSDTHR